MKHRSETIYLPYIVDIINGSYNDFITELQDSFGDVLDNEMKICILTKMLEYSKNNINFCREDIFGNTRLLTKTFIENELGQISK